MQLFTDCSAPQARTFASPLNSPDDQGTWTCIPFPPGIFSVYVRLGNAASFTICIVACHVCHHSLGPPWLAKHVIRYIRCYVSRRMSVRVLAVNTHETLTN